MWTVYVFLMLVVCMVTRPGEVLSVAISVSLCLCVCLLAYLKKSSAVAEMGDRDHSRHGPKIGGCCASFVGAATPSCTMWLGSRSTSVPSGSSSTQPFGHNRHGPKIGWRWVCLFSGGSCVHIEHNVA